MNIRKHIVPTHTANKVTYGGDNTKEYIVIHETDNTSKGANADAHSRLQYNGNSRQASWHYQTDDKEIVQSFSDNAQCWHAGNMSYNKTSIGIEICVNSDGNYKKAVDNAIELTKYLMAKYNIPKSRVVQHNRASGKNCPRNLRSGAKGITWSQFLAKLDGKPSSNNNASKPTPKPSKPSKKSFQWVGTNDKGKRIESIYKGKDKLNFYDGPRWTNPTGTFGYGEGWKVDNLYRVNGSLMYRVQNSQGKLYWITASPKYVKVTNKTYKTSKPKSKAIKAGQTVTLKKTAKKFTTGENIAASAKGKKYTVHQVSGNKVLLKSGNSFIGWVLKSDVV